MIPMDDYASVNRDYAYVNSLGGSKDYVYTIYAIETDHATDDAFAAAEIILETAQSKN